MCCGVCLQTLPQVSQLEREMKLAAVWWGHVQGYIVRVCAGLVLSLASSSFPLQNEVKGYFWKGHHEGRLNVYIF